MHTIGSCLPVPVFGITIPYRYRTAAGVFLVSMHGYLGHQIDNKNQMYLQVKADRKRIKKRIKRINLPLIYPLFSIPNMAHWIHWKSCIAASS